MIKSLAEKALSKAPLTKEDGLYISSIEGAALSDLFSEANRLRDAFCGDRIDLCSIVNAKSGLCPENCSYCAQSSRAKSNIERYPLAGEPLILEKAKEAKAFGAKRFCIVTSGKKASWQELEQIASMISGVRN